jgi:DNA processing protein
MDRAALVALLRVRPDKMTWPEITTEVVEIGCAMEVWDRHMPATLLESDGEALIEAAADIELWQGQGHTFLTILDDDYPTRLRGIHEAPPVLFAHGTLLRDDPAVSVVGSRDASERGLAIARSVGTALAQEGVTVLAGLALGIDTAAHLAALESGGRTVAVIGTGINNTYPAANRDLHRVIAKDGLLLSQFWPDAPPQKHTFLMRNATMSGYGVATVVVEAGEQSGARAQARMAVAHGRPVILTDLVVERNDWAKGLVSRPGVHVATGLDDVMGVVRKLTAEREAVQDQLRVLLSA